jgi:threonine/homoserine/homoserine lactone efflux protein
MLTYLGLGLSLGLSAGLSPGPLSALLVASTLRSGLAGGLRVALAPLLTDLPIIILAVLLVDRMPHGALRWLGPIGGLVVAWMAIETLRSARSSSFPDDAAPAAAPAADPRRELWRGVLVNATNPHPYLFWATVGAPILVKGWRASPWLALAFLLPFYALLVGSKVVLAWLVSRGAGRLSQTWYRRILAGSGVLMLVMAGVLIRQFWVG